MFQESVTHNFLLKICATPPRPVGLRLSIPASHNKNQDNYPDFYYGAPGRNRTCNNGLEVRSYIHLTTGAHLTHLR